MEDPQPTTAPTEGPDAQVTVDDPVEDITPQPASVEEEKALIKQFEKESRDRGLKVGDVQYLVATRWYKAWKEFVVWDSYYRSNIPAPRPGPIENDPLIESGAQPGQEKVRKTVMEQYDYIFVSPKTWRHWLAWYGGGPVLARKVIASGWGSNNLIIEVRLLSLQVFKSSAMTEGIAVDVSKSLTVEEFKKLMCEKLNLNPDDVRVWDFHGNNKYKQLDDLTQRLEQVQIIDGQPMLLEEKDADGKFPEPPKQQRSYGGGGYGYSSGGYYYSNQGGPTEPGTTGLINLGNTCFMNSSLQCLSQTPPLVDYLLEDKYKAEVNADNPLGMKGELAEEYANLVKQLWSGNNSAVAPRDFKWKLERFAPQFAGYQQHDSQELLAFLLDGLHEDLNRIRQKPYTENPEVGDRPQEEVAREAWQRHRARNDSFVVDWFQGQLRSTLVCPKCDRVSITFDPFMYLSLPLPMKTTRVITVNMFFMDPEKFPTQYGVEVNKYASIRDLCNALAELAGVPAQRIALTEVYNARIFKYYNDKESIDAIQDRDIICGYEVDVTDNENDDIAYFPVNLRVARVMRNPHYYYHNGGTYIQHAGFGFPFILSVRNSSNVTYKQLYALIYQRLRRFLRLPKDQVIFHTGQLQPATTPQQQQQPTDAASASSSAQDGGKAESDTENTIGNDNNGGAQQAQSDSDDGDMDQEMQNMDGMAEDEDLDSSASDIDSDDEDELEKRRQAAARSEQRSAQRQKKTRKQPQEGQQQDQEDDEPEPIFEVQVTDQYRSTTDMALTDNDLPLNLQDRSALAVTFSDATVSRFYSKKAEEDVEVHDSVNKHRRQDDVGSETVTLDKCMDLFTIAEKLGPEDPWYCNKCKEFQQATKKFDLWKLPPILVIHLKRFSYKNKYWRDKLETFVDYPVHDLDLSAYAKGPQEVPPMYELYAVSNHYGSMGGGHYTAYAKNKKNGKWYKFDDSSVSPIDESKVRASSGYVLFYRRKDTITAEETANQNSTAASTDNAAGTTSTTNNDSGSDEMSNGHDTMKMD